MTKIDNGIHKFRGVKDDYAKVYRHNHERYGKAHANEYVNKLEESIIALKSEKHHSAYEDADKVAAKLRDPNLVKDNLFVSRFKGKPTDKTGWKVFYRFMDDGDIGVLAVFHDREDFPENIRKRFEKVAFEIKRDMAQPKHKAASFDETKVKPKSKGKKSKTKTKDNDKGGKER